MISSQSTTHRMEKRNYNILYVSFSFVHTYRFFVRKLAPRETCSPIHLLKTLFELGKNFWGKERRELSEAKAKVKKKVKEQGSRVNSLPKTSVPNFYRHPLSRGTGTKDLGSRKILYLLAVLTRIVCRERTRNGWRSGPRRLMPVFSPRIMDVERWRVPEFNESRSVEIDRSAALSFSILYNVVLEYVWDI